jgi:hypothetical protein
MTRILKRLLSPLWRLTLPQRRFLAERLHAHVEDAGVTAVSHQARVLAAQPDDGDLTLVLDSVVRELVRLQMQVDVLQQLLEERHGRAPGFALAAGPTGEPRDISRAG